MGNIGQDQVANSEGMNRIGKWLPGAQYQHKPCIHDHLHGCCNKQGMCTFFFFCKKESEKQIDELINALTFRSPHLALVYSFIFSIGYEMHFKFDNESLNGLDTRKIFLSKLRNKNLILLGDSLMDQLFEGIVEALELKGRVNDTYGLEINAPEKYKIRTIGHGQNGIIKFLRFYNIYNPSIADESYVQDIFVRPYTLLHHITENSYVVLNFGLHYKGWTVVEFKNIVRQTLPLIKNKATKGALILRNTLPQHFQSKFNTGRYGRYIFGNKCAPVSQPERHPTDMIVEHYAKLYNIKILDDSGIFADRWDLHQQTKFPKLDCTHFCYTPATVWPQLTLLSQLL